MQQEENEAEALDIIVEERKRAKMEKFLGTTPVTRKFATFDSDLVGQYDQPEPSSVMSVMLSKDEIKNLNRDNTTLTSLTLYKNSKATLHKEDTLILDDQDQLVSRFKPVGELPRDQLLLSAKEEVGDFTRRLKTRLHVMEKKGIVDVDLNTTTGTLQRRHQLEINNGNEKTNISHHSELDARDAALARKPIPLELALDRKNVSRKVKRSLLVEAYSMGIENLTKMGISPLGWTKDLSSILTTGSQGLISQDFNLRAGWNNKETLDAYDLGISCVIPATAENKISLIRGFLLYVNSFDKPPPWTLEDVYSFVLRLAASGYTIKGTMMTSIVRDLLPFRLILDSFGSFHSQFSMYKEMLTNAGKKEEVTKCKPWGGAASLEQATRMQKWMLALWINAGTRFSTMKQLTYTDVMQMTLKGIDVIVLTLWSDKILCRQGRQLVLSCSCVLGLDQDCQLCPVCNFPSGLEMMTSLIPMAWVNLANCFQIVHHAMRRRMAIELYRYNLRQSAAGKILIKYINLFLGWTEKSKMFLDYTADYAKVKDQIFLNPFGRSLARNIELTWYLATPSLAKGISNEVCRLAVQKASLEIQEIIDANLPLWEMVERLDL